MSGCIFQLVNEIYSCKQQTAGILALLVKTFRVHPFGKKEELRRKKIECEDFKVRFLYFVWKIKWKF